MGTEFGRQLRAQRNTRGLTLTDLASAAWPPGHICLIEEGRREPTPELVRELAARLQLTPAQLNSWDHVPAPADAAYILHSMAARQSHDLREYDRAAAHAAQAAAAALEAGKPGAWWDMAFLHAQCLLRLRHFTESVPLAKQLLDHPLANVEALAARAHHLLALAERGRGRITIALEHARGAVLAAAGAQPRTRELLESLQTLVELLADGGELEEAWHHCRLLSDLAEDEPAGPLQGSAHGAVGNIAFMRGDCAEGTARHERAAQMLSPANDLGLWAAFNKAAAAARIAGGHLGPETASALKKANLAYSVIGGTRADHLELSLLHAQLLYATGDPAQALSLLRDVHEEKNLLGHHQAAHASRLLARALEAAGRPDEAREALAEAAEDLLLTGLRKVALRATTKQ